MEGQDVMQTRTYEFEHGFLHLERAAVKDMPDEEVAEMYGGRLLKAQDSEMPAEDFFNLPDFNDL